MDVLPSLQTITPLLATVSDETLEDLLVAVDSLVNVSDGGQRPAVAVLIRTAARSAADEQRRQRLMRAADAVLSGEPCARTPEGLTAAQAAAAQTVTLEEWERSEAARLTLPPEPELAEHQDDEDDEDEDEDEFLDEPPPKLPQLPVRFFFPGLVIRAARDFTDADGKAVCCGKLMQVLRCDSEDGGYRIACLTRNLRVTDKAALENAGNEWFQPVPTTACLEDLCEAIDGAISDLVEDGTEYYGGDDDYFVDELQSCQQWLSGSSALREAPDCPSAPRAAKVFGRKHPLGKWFPLLSAGVKVRIEA